MAFIYITQETVPVTKLCFRLCRTGTNGPTLLCITDIEDNTFGALVSSPIVMSERFYGTGETFLFSATPVFKVFKWSQENSNFVRYSNLFIESANSQDVQNNLETDT